MSQMPQVADIPVVILCGGEGTRIREASEKLPKPLIPIGGQPILWHIMKLYGSYGFRKFVLCLGYKGWDIKHYFIRYQEMISDVTLSIPSGDVSYTSETGVEDWEISLVDTGLHSGTGGRLAKVAPYLNTEYFMLTYGDGLGDVNLEAQINQLMKSDHMGLVTGVHPTSRYGELTVEKDTVVSFAEKLPSDSWVSGGFFAFKKAFLDYIPQDDPAHFFEHDPTQKLARENKLGIFKHQGFWMGMDTFREYTALNKLWEEDKAPWKLWE